MCMFKLSQLKELQHSLSRARALAESLTLTDIAEATHASISKVSEEIRKMGTQAPEPATPKTVRKSRQQVKESEE